MEKKDNGCDYIEDQSITEIPKKTVGIITFHTADNYGALYQCYALQEVIKSISNFDVEVINYCTKKHIYAYKLIRKRSPNVIKSIVRNLEMLPIYKDLKKKKSLFQNFRKQYLCLSEKRYLTETELLSSHLPYDICVSGSDQVFHPFIEDHKAYYMCFENYGGKKIAYAPSFGIKNFDKKVEDIVRPLIKGYSFLSCREIDGARFLSTITNTIVPVVLDPVFLLPPNKWRDIENFFFDKHSDYIYVYNLAGNQRLLQVAKKVQDKFKLPIICATSICSTKMEGVTFLYDVGPLEMIGNIDRASFVITDSFHGLAMALSLNKKVIAYVANKTASSRLISLCEQLKISEQIVQDAETFDISSIKFKSYQAQLQKLRNDSINYLQKALS